MKYNKVFYVAMGLIFSHGTSEAQGGFEGGAVRLQADILNAPKCNDRVIDFGVRVVGPDIEWPTLGGGLVSVAIDLDSNSVVLDYSQAGSGVFCSGQENTYVFTDSGNSIPPILSVLIDTNVTTLGISADDVTFTENEIRINVEGVLFFSSSFVRLIVAFDSPPCLADTNNDGSLTPTDFTAWINAFNNNLPECDQNGDGACTPTDFTAWIANFNAGC